MKQLLSGEIWGRRPSWGGSPYVKAYAGKLPDAVSGIEFWAFQAPDTPHGPRIAWRTAGPSVTMDKRNDTVKLQVAFVRVTQDLHVLTT